MINAILEKLPNIIQGYPDHVAEYLNGGELQTLHRILNIQHTVYMGRCINDIVESYLRKTHNMMQLVHSTHYHLINPQKY